MVTSTVQPVGAIARSVYIVERAKAPLFTTDNKVRFGDEVRIKVNPYIIGKDLFLHSVPISTLAYARFSRNQEVCLNSEASYNTVWRIQPTPGGGYYNEEVKAGVPIILEHCATQQYLSNDKIPYRNDFGNELEVSAKTLATKNKSQILAKEKTGEATRESTHKAVPTQNFWTFELAAKPSSAESFEPIHVRYSCSKLIEDIKKTLS